MRSSIALWSIPLIGGLIATAYLAAQTPQSEEPKKERAPRVVQDRGENSIRVMGTVESAEAVDLASPVDGRIKMIVADGTPVKKGDLLIELESEQAGELQTNTILVAQAEARVAQAAAAVDTAKMQWRAIDIQAQKQKKLADLARHALTAENGELALKEQELSSALLLASERLKVTQLVIRAVEVAAPPDSPELARARLDMQAAETEVKLAEVRKQYFQEHERPTKTAEAEYAVIELELAATREKHVAEANVRAAEADLQAAKIALDITESKLEAVKQRTAESSIQAPRDGLVLAYRSGRDARELQAGDAVRERQRLLQLVDPQQLQVHVRLDEIQIQRVQVGQAATITIDALPDKSFQGRVIKVNEVPEAASFYNQGVREYGAIVSLDKRDLVRIGMTAQVTIDTQQSTERSSAPRKR